MRRYEIHSGTRSGTVYIRYVRADEVKVKDGILLLVDSREIVTHMFAAGGWDSIIDVTEENN